uniref:Sporangia induced mitogenactivated protein kinase pu n=1 Tax=Hirondellea gigas TaxID=1518452 RepID=A0A6A7GBJ3_9CRUS
MRKESFERSNFLHSSITKTLFHFSIWFLQFPNSVLMIYMVLGFMETDLHKIIYSKNPLSEEHIQYFIYQVLRGVKYIHSANVIHRDLKPSNLLLNQNCDLKICDLGLARGVDNSSNFELTEYVVTRWYRAPEIMCSCQDYDKRIDVWSIGCILGELLGRTPLFPGENYIDQLNLIFKYLGTPKAEDLTWVTNGKALAYIRDQSFIKGIRWKKIFPKASALSLDFLSQMLVFNPNKRISIEDALAHPFLKQLHNPQLEPTCPKTFDFAFEKSAHTDRGIRRLMYQEVMQWRNLRRR